jgi:hypothetical protein
MNGIEKKNDSVNPVEIILSVLCDLSDIHSQWSGGGI